MSSCSSDGYESCDSTESFSFSAVFEYTDSDQDPGTPPAYNLRDYSSDDSDEQTLRYHEAASYETDSISRSIERWSWFCSQQLNLERLTVRWEVEYHRTQDRLDDSDIPVISVSPVILPLPPLCTKICTQNSLCAPPAGMQHALDRSLVACCTQHQRRPYDPGKHLAVYSTSSVLRECV